MSLRSIEVRGRTVELWEQGAGRPLVYLHGFADIHAAADGPLEFHERLAGSSRVIAPAHPGVGATAELDQGHAPSDAVFHYLELFDALGLDRFDLVGHCVGGWLAAEIAVTIPERIGHLALIGASGLFVEGSHIADIFMHVQPDRGVDLSSLRRMLFARADHPQALRYFPDRRGETGIELRRYQMLRFASFIGFRPPYLYDRALRSRLHRARMPAAVIWGEDDALVPLSHGEAYAVGLPGARGRLMRVPGAGHSVPMEAGKTVAGHVLGLFA